MLAISDRDSPCSALISPSSEGLVTVITPASCLTSIGSATARLRVPFGPFTGDVAAADGHVHAGGHDDGHPSDS